MTTLDVWIRDAAALHPEKPAFVFQGEVITYAQFADLISERAACLLAGGIARGDRIAWYGMNNPEAFVLLFAAAKIGAILLPLNWRLSAVEVAEIVENATPKIVFHDHHFASQAAGLDVPLVLEIGGDIPLSVNNEQGVPSLNDPLLLVYTSGSTGRPKGVILPQKALVANAQMSVQAHGMRPTDTVLNVLPLFHVGGLNILPTPAFSIGATVELHESFNPTDTALALNRVDLAIVVPTVLAAVMATPEWRTKQSETLRGLSIGSTDVPLEMLKAVHACGVPMLQVYGATETTPFAIFQTVDTAMINEGSIGIEGANCQIRLVVDDQDVAQGDAGEIWVKGDNVFTHYWQDPVETQKALEDGWFKTGDVARQDSDGNYWFVDRIKHVIISGGENIYPSEIERLLRDHPKLAEVAVVGAADVRWGEVPIVVAVSKTDCCEADVVGVLDGKLARYKMPKKVLFVAALPRNAMGKIVAADVRAMIN